MCFFSALFRNTAILSSTLQYVTTRIFSTFSEVGCVFCPFLNMAGLQRFHSVISLLQLDKLYRRQLKNNGSQA